MTIALSPESLNPPPAPPQSTCALHTYLTLPSTVFGDEYQLSTTDPLFLQSHNLVDLRAFSGETDLEAPDWAVQAWGSTWLFELATPDQEISQPWNVTIPLHLRYLRPSESGYRTTSIPWPVVFWACTSDQDINLSGNPFDKTQLGWDTLFGPNTMFYQINPDKDAAAGRLVEDLDVPVLRLGDGEGLFRTTNIELGTVAVITLGLLWVLWKLGVVALAGPDQPAEGRQSREKKEK